MLTEKIKLEDDEFIVEQIRKHWFVLFEHFFGLVVAALFPLALMLIITSVELFAPLRASLSMSTPHIVFFYAAWLMLISFACFSIWTNYYLDVWTITNKRLIIVDQQGLFKRSTGSFRLERLQNIHVEVNGFIATFLNFGRIHAQTAGEHEEHFNFVATGLPDPQGIKSRIFENADKLLHTNTKQDSTGT